MIGNPYIEQMMRRWGGATPMGAGTMPSQKPGVAGGPGQYFAQPVPGGGTRMPQAPQPPGGGQGGPPQAQPMPAPGMGYGRGLRPPTPPAGSMLTAVEGGATDPGGGTEVQPTMPGGSPMPIMGDAMSPDLFSRLFRSFGGMFGGA